MWERQPACPSRITCEAVLDESEGRQSTFDATTNPVRTGPQKGAVSGSFSRSWMTILAVIGMLLLRGSELLTQS